MKRRGWIVAGCAAMLVSAICCNGCGKKEDSSDRASQHVSDQTGIQSEEPVAADAIEFPYEMEDGKLIINSLFQSSIANPDNQDLVGEDIASIEIANVSDKLMESVELTLVMPDDSLIHFKGELIPPGRQAWLFATESEPVDMQASCSEITGQVTYGESQMMDDQIEVAVEDNTVTLRNLTEEDLSDLTMKCHCLFEENYYGGIVYSYPVELIPAGAEVTVEVVDCFMGIPDVVSIR